LDIVYTARVARNAKSFAREFSEKYPIITDIIEGAFVFADLEEAIDKCIDREGNIMDTASQELYRIRRQVISLRSKITKQLESMLHSPQYQPAIQDNLITLRNNRYVIPVKQNLKSSLPGVVQSRSASGVTAFVEPIAVVDMNNQLQELANAELSEIRRILRELTDKIRNILPEIESTVKILAELDLINSKALFCIRLGTTRPVLNDRGYVNLIQARHPALQFSLNEHSSVENEGNYPKKIVPVDFYIGDIFDTLVITGPNTGGKTVALKTVGLLTLMMQYGLHVPAKDGSEMSVFKEIFADIGDEQSIEQNLSTFSSHITRITAIIEGLDESSLVLLDELGAGTEPSEGAALGMGILDHLHSRRVRTVATTHHDSLKAHAYSTEGMENASVAFDLMTLKPTYELRIGMPGSSNALKIADRLGLPEEIIDSARKYLDPEQIQMTDLILTVEEMQRELEKQQKLAEEKTITATKIQQEHEKLLSQLKSKRKEIERDALMEASNIIQGARKLVENAIAEVKKEKASTISIRQTRQNLAKAQEEISAALTLDDKKDSYRESKSPSPEELSPGNEIYIKSLKCKGILADPLDSKGMAQVIVGSAKIRLPISDFVFVSNKRSEKPDIINHHSSINVKSNVPDTLNLRGYRASEALEKTDKYLDDAALAGFGSISIIHGVGTGALREAVTRLLSEHPHVANFRPGDKGEGGKGVTIVELR